MSGIGVHISVSNVPQFDRLQSDIHRTPAVNQTQNAEIARTKSEQQVRIPTEAKGPEGKNVDPDNRKKNQERSKKRKRVAPVALDVPESRRGSDSGSLIDIEA